MIPQVRALMAVPIPPPTTTYTKTTEATVRAQLPAVVPIPPTLPPTTTQRIEAPAPRYSPTHQEETLNSVIQSLKAELQLLKKQLYLQNITIQRHTLITDELLKCHKCPPTYK